MLCRHLLQLQSTQTVVLKKTCQSLNLSCSRTPKSYLLLPATKRDLRSQSPLQHKQVMAQLQQIFGWSSIVPKNIKQEIKQSVCHIDSKLFIRLLLTFIRIILRMALDDKLSSFPFKSKYWTCTSISNGTIYMSKSFALRCSFIVNGFSWFSNNPKISSLFLSRRVFSLASEHVTSFLNFSAFWKKKQTSKLIK